MAYMEVSMGIRRKRHLYFFKEYGCDCWSSHVGVCRFVGLWAWSIFNCSSYVNLIYHAHAC